MVWKSRSNDVPHCRPSRLTASNQWRINSGIAGGLDPATVFGQERPLGDDVQAGEEGQPLVEHGAHDVAVACVAEELQGQQRPHGAGGRDHLRAGESGPREELVQVGGRQPGEEEEQAAELGAEVARRQVELADIGDIGGHGPGLVGPLVVAPPRQLGEALLLEDRGDGRRAERLAVAGQGAADVVDGEVLLAQGDDLIAEPSLLAGRPAFACGRDEEVAVGLIAELMDEDAKAPRRVAEAAAASAEGRPSTKKARRASYCRWVELAGSKNRRASVRRSLELSSMLPRCHPDS